MKSPASVRIRLAIVRPKRTASIAVNIAGKLKNPELWKLAADASTLVAASAPAQNPQTRSSSRRYS